ncbi:ribonuclease H-like domain-containing protein, partial [Mycena polygramma]
YDPNGDRFLQCFGKSLKDHSEFAGMFHVRTNHWVGAAVDLLGQSIEYGDPGGDEIEDARPDPNNTICHALQWFVDQHRSNSADLAQAELPCTKQEDSHNCGLYGPNAIAHRFLPDEHPLYSADLVLGDLGRLDILQRLIAKFHDSHVCLSPFWVCTSSQFRSLSTTPPSTPPPQDDVLSNALRQLSVSPKKRPNKRRKTEGSQQRPPIAPIFKLQPKPAAKKSVNKVVKRESQSSKKPLAAGQAKKEARVAALKSVSDLPVEDQPTYGRPRSEEMDNLTVEVESKFKTGTRAYRCAGTGCIKIFNPRTLARVLAHGKRCTFLTATQRQYASKHSADTSPGARAEQLAQGLSAEQLEPPALPVTEFFGSAGAAQVREHLKAKLDLAIVKLFCAAGLPPRLADYPEYKEVLRLAALAGPRYTPAGRTILMDNHIMSEQERVRELQLAVLRSKTRLTVSFDGGDTRLGENFYTVHASMHDGRSFLLEGKECTSVSHTAEWMAAMVMEVMETVGIQRFIGALSDNTGNTRGCRRILCDKIPTMLNLPDPNHHLNNMIKDILKIPYFKLTIKILRTTIKTFNQSKQSKAMLKQLRLQHSSGPGLETIGKTRFATVTLAAISLKRNMRHIRTLCTNGQVEIKVSVNGQVIAVTEGAAKAITCLESASCTPADVYLLWLAVTAHLRDALADSLLPQGVCDEIRGIVNQRWKEFFVTNPGHGAYEAAFYLNPS